MHVQAGLCRTCSETTLLVFPRGGSNAGNVLSPLPVCMRSDKQNVSGMDHAIFAGHGLPLSNKTATNCSIVSLFRPVDFCQVVLVSQTVFK